jgi:hypothetical protein
MRFLESGYSVPLRIGKGLGRETERDDINNDNNTK